MTRLNGAGQPANVSTFGYTPEGTVLFSKRALGAAANALVTTYAHAVQYIRSGQQTSLTATDNTLGNKDVSIGDRTTAVGTGSSSGDGSVLFAVSDRIQTLSPRGNASGATASQFRTSYTVARTSTVNPNEVSNNSCTSRNSGLVCAVSTPDSTSGPASTYFAYDSSGQKTAMTTPRGTNYSYGYYGPGSTDTSGSTSSEGWLRTVTDPAGQFVFFTYDAAGNVQRTYDRDATAGSNSTTFTGAGNSQYTEALHATGGNKPWRYMRSQRDELGNTSTSLPDGNGNPVTLTSARGNASTQTFDAGNLLQSRKLALDVTPMTMHYDLWGNNDWTQDQRGSYTGMKYDIVNRLIATIKDRGPSSTTAKPTACHLSTAGEAPFPAALPANEVLCDTKTSYDMHDNPTASTDGEGQVSTATYDQVDRRLTSTIPRSASVAYTGTNVYDADGNVTDTCPPRETLEGGNAGCPTGGLYSTHTSYDPAGRKSTLTTYRAAPQPMWLHGSIASAPATSTNITRWDYDGNGNVTTITDPNGHITRNTFDNLDRKSSTSTPRSSARRNTSYYRYSPAGDPLAVIAPDTLNTGTGTTDLVVDGTTNPSNNPYRLSSGTLAAYRSITLQNGGWIAPPAGANVALDLQVADTLTICSSCGITLAGQGRPGGTAGSGPLGNGTAGNGPGGGGAGQSGATVGGNGGSAGHANAGAAGSPGGTGSGTPGAAGNSYGSSDFTSGLANETGSGGGAGGNAGTGIGGNGGAGGGALHITTANLILDGTIDVSGAAGTAGTVGTLGTGGAGAAGSNGAVWITAQAISGTGQRPAVFPPGNGGSGGHLRVDADGSTNPYIDINHQLGRITAYSYDAAHRRVDTVTGADNTSAGSAGLAAVTGGTNTRSRTLYDADNQIVGTLEPRAFATSTSNPDRRFETVMVYDANHRLTDIYKPRLDTASFNDPYAGTPSTQCPDAASIGIADYSGLTGVRACHTRVAYDANGNRSRVDFPTYTASNTNRYTAYSYTPDNLLLAVDNPDPRQTSSSSRISQAHKYVYDGAGRVVKDEQVTTQDPAVVTTYTSDGLVATITAPAGDQTHLVTNGYDSNGNKSQVTLQQDAGTSRVSYTDYYTDNTPYTAVDPAGDTTSYHYDQVGQTTAVYSPSANTTDATDTTNQGKEPTRTAYYDDNLVKATLVPTGASHRLISYGYDGGGRRVTTDADLVTGTDPNTPGTVTLNGSPQTLGYYNNDRLASLTGRTGETQSWDYDAAGNTIRASDSTSGLNTTSSYYLDGLVRSVTSDSRIVNYGYDGAGQVYARNYWNGSTYANQTFAYTDAEQPYSWTNGLAGGTTNVTYDDQGRQKTSTGGLGGVTTAQTWNADDTLRISSTTASSGSIDNWNYRYDGMLRITAANNASAITDCTTGQGYGTPTPTAGLHCFDYDTAGRLWHFRDTQAARTATYDHDSNRTSYPTGTQKSTYNPDDSLKTQVLASGQLKTSTYNTYAFGGVTSDECTNYTYDGLDRLNTRAGTGVTGCPSSTASTSYAYDGLNRQISRVESGTGAITPGTTAFRYDGATSAIAEEVTPGGSLISYGLKPSAAFDSSAPQSVATSGNAQYLTTDGQGSVSAAVGSNGSLACALRYDPYGSPLEVPQNALNGQSCTNLGGSTLSDVLYRSARRDTSSGTYQLGSRTYDPSKNSFLTPDSMNTGPSSGDAGLGMDPLTRNSYTYVNGDPVNFTDPSGHSRCSTLERQQGCYEAREDNIPGRSAADKRQTSYRQMEAREATAVARRLSQDQAWIDSTGGQYANLIKFGLAHTNDAYFSLPVGFSDWDATQIRRFLQQESVYTVAREADKAASDNWFGPKYQVAVDLFLAVEGARGMFAGIKSLRAAEGGTSALRVCGNSFDAGTLVLMADGTKKSIKDVELGDWVMAANQHSGRRVQRQVIDLIRHGGQHRMARVRLVNGSTIHATDRHPFWVVNRGATGTWIYAIDLEAGDQVQTADGGLLKVASVGVSIENLWAYNLTVADVHTYYVGENSVLVHNAVCPTGLRDASTGLRDVFDGGSVRGRSISSIRASLFESGFTQGLTKNKSGYLFTNGAGEEVRIMSRGGAWDIRVRNSAGNYLDEFGNVPVNGSPAHDIFVYAR